MGKTKFGFVNSELRKKIWPILLGIDDIFIETPLDSVNKNSDNLAIGLFFVKLENYRNY